MTDLKTQIEAIDGTLPERQAAMKELAKRHNAGRKPQFGDLMLNPWAGESNPQREGYFVRAERKTGRMNPGLWYEFTDRKGNFWSTGGDCALFSDAALVSAQSAAVAGEQKPVACGACNGSGWVPRDPDIGTEQECFSCGGSGESDDAEVEPREPVGEAYFQPGSLSRTMATFDYSQVPPGAKLYTHPAPADVEALRVALEQSLKAMESMTTRNVLLQWAIVKSRAALAALGKGV